jgi:hypothetical protein
MYVDSRILSAGLAAFKKKPPGETGRRGDARVRRDEAATTTTGPMCSQSPL